MSAADFVQTNGFADRLCPLMNHVISSWRWETEVKTPRRSRFLVKMEKKPSTALSQEADAAPATEEDVGLERVSGQRKYALADCPWPPPREGHGSGYHSDRGSQYLSIRYTERLAEAGIEPSVGSVGDSYDNAWAETINGPFKVEVIQRRGPWRSVEAAEYATLEWGDWFSNRRLLEHSETFRPQRPRPTSTPLWKPKPWPRNH